MFSQIPPEDIHPVDRYGYDPIPGNRGEYVWVEGQGYLPGVKTYDYNVVTGRFDYVGYTLKSSSDMHNERTYE